MDEACRVERCGKSVLVKKHRLCRTHYHRWHRHGDPEAWKKPTRSTCETQGCGQPKTARGLCDTHYRRFRRYGTTDRPERPTVCSVSGCVRTVQTHGRCDRHY